MTNLTSKGELQVKAVPCCPLCGRQGENFHSALRDRLYGAPGTWNIRRCVGLECGLFWLDPAPLETSMGRAYERYYTHSQREPGEGSPQRLYSVVREAYLAARLGYRERQPLHWRRWVWPLAHLDPRGAFEIALEVMALPAPSPGMRLLDVGCGGGQLLARMRDLGWLVEGVDVDPLGVESARARGMPARVGTLEEQHYLNASFDAVTMSHVIEHVYDPARLLAECRRVLKPAGTLVVRTPNSQSWGHARFKEDWVGLDPPRHLHVFSTRNLRPMVEDAGFVIATLESVASSFVRFALSMSEAVRENRLHSRHVEWDPKPGARIRRLAYQVWERVLVRLDATAAEELLLVARKVTEAETERDWRATNEPRQSPRAGQRAGD